MDLEAALHVEHNHQVIYQYDIFTVNVYRTTHSLWHHCYPHQRDYLLEIPESKSTEVPFDAFPKEAWKFLSSESSFACNCHGHGICQLDGTCGCFSGWTGNNCSTANPHKNAGGYDMSNQFKNHKYEEVRRVSGLHYCLEKNGKEVRIDTASNIDLYDKQVGEVIQKLKHTGPLCSDFQQNLLCDM